MPETFPVTVSGTVDGQPVNAILTVTVEDAPPPLPEPVPYSETTADGSQVQTTDKTMVTLLLQIDNGVTIEKIGMFSAVARSASVKIVRRVSPGIYDVLVSESMSHDGGGWQDHTLSAPFVVPASGEYYPAAWADGSLPRVPATALRAVAAAPGSLPPGNGQSFPESDGTNIAMRVSGTRPAP